ncbi:recombinase family protein [uncultured Tyzzerella sp.]|uniref:recombinase family protein n=1 Tax=uncultured Tyzzerella sp. TaxID=2321398 RepID=UPI0029431665|nr:recombinase family protein [uncultured Tyzzerella sp.]
MKKAVAYVRMSTDKQDYSIESQKRTINEYAKKNSYNIIKYFEDKGISGRDAEKRPAFMTMIEESKKGYFDYVIIYDSSRFARNLEQSLIYKSILKKNNVNLISITEPMLDDDSQLIADALFGAMNEMYSRKLSKVVKRGMTEKALKGEYISCAPYGYFKPKNKPLVIVEKEANIVKEIFRLFLNGKSTYAIAKILNENNIKTKKGNSIDTRFVKKILTNPTYKGYYRFETEKKVILNKSTHTPIIDEDTFDKVQILFNNNNKRLNSKNKPLEYNKHWLTGMIKCVHCNSTFVYAKYYNNRQDRFRCGGYTCGKCDSSFSIGIYNIEDIVIEKIKEIYPNKKYKIKNISDTNQKKYKLLKDIEKYKKALEKAKDAYFLEIDTLEEYSKNKTFFTKKIKDLETQLKDFKKTNNNIQEISILSILTGNYNMALKTKISKLVINKILIDGKNRKIKIIFNAY